MSMVKTVGMITIGAVAGVCTASYVISTRKVVPKLDTLTDKVSDVVNEVVDKVCPDTQRADVEHDDAKSELAVESSDNIDILDVLDNIQEDLSSLSEYVSNIQSSILKMQKSDV